MKKKAPMRSPNIDLLNAVGAFVRSKGGEVMVAGGISTMKFPDDPEYTFHIAVRCTGRAPVPQLPEAEQIRQKAMPSKPPEAKPRCYCIIPNPTRGRWKRCKSCGGRVLKTFDPNRGRRR